MEAHLYLGLKLICIEDFTTHSNFTFVKGSEIKLMNSKEEGLQTIYDVYILNGLESHKNLLIEITKFELLLYFTNLSNSN